jgi:acetyl-CoA acetyltransferase
VLAKRGADDLAAISICELIGRHPRVDWSAVDDVMLGCANQACEDNRNIVGMAWTGAFHPL